MFALVVRGWEGRGRFDESGAAARHATKLPESLLLMSGEDNQLREMLDAGKRTAEIALKLHRTPQAIYAKLQRLYRKRRPAS